MISYYNILLHKILDFNQGHRLTVPRAQKTQTLQLFPYRCHSIALNAKNVQNKKTNKDLLNVFTNQNINIYQTVSYEKCKVSCIMQFK